MCKSVTIRSKIAEVRTANNMTQLELAFQLKLDPSLLRRVEGIGRSKSAYTGKSISIELLNNLCEIFKCQPGDLFVYEAEES